MNIYLVRHTEAEKSAFGKKDYERQLTQHGEVKIKNAAEGWKSLIPSIDLIVSSPLVRAVQTAEIIKNVYNFSKDIIIDKAISPGSHTEQICEVANTYDVENIFFVGHQPDLGEHASNLISSEGALIEFKKGTIAKISFSGKAKLSRGILEFLIPASAY